MKLSELNWAALDDADDVLLDITACSVSVLVRGRNAWHSTWVKHWFRNSHLFSDHRAARLGAEDLRQRGNVFYVRDRPALVLAGVRSRIVVFDGFSSEPFRHFRGVTEEVVTRPWGSYCKGVFPAVSLREAVAAFQAGSEWWPTHHAGANDVRFAVVPDGCPLGPATTQVQSSTSFAQGAGYYLGWETEQESVSIEWTLHQEREWGGLLWTAVDWVRSASADRLVLAELLRSRFPEGADPARDKLDLYERFIEATRRADDAVAAAEREWEEAQVAEQEAEEALYDAEQFAEDPWADPLADVDATAAAVREARERALNADRLVDEARERYEKAGLAVSSAWQRLQDAEREQRALRFE